MNKIIKYFAGVKAELTKVTWPTRETAINMTGIVIGASIVVGLYIGGLDFAFTNILGLLIN